jgi:hypothetical protein
VGDADPMVVDRDYIVAPVPLDNDEDDVDIERTVVLASMRVKTAIAQDGAEAADLRTLLDQLLDRRVPAAHLPNAAT